MCGRRENGRTCRLDMECLYTHQVRDFGWRRGGRRKRRACNHHRYRKRVLTDRDHHLLQNPQVCAPQMRGDRIISGSRWPCLGLPADRPDSRMDWSWREQDKGPCPVCRSSSEEHTSGLQSLMTKYYYVFRMKKKT